MRARATRRIRVRATAGVLAGVLAGTLALGSCAAPVTVAAVRDNYRKALVESGEDAALAKCVTDRFFEHRTNADVRAFQKRAHLTDDEKAEFARLAVLCRPT